jgi:hypothetical protein
LVVDGDLVLVAPGIYARFSFAGKAVVVRSQGGPSVTAVGTMEFANIDTASSVLSGFRIDGGPGTLISLHSGPTWAGGCILSYGAPTVDNCVLTGGVVDAAISMGGNAYGGAVYTTGPMTLINCTIANNSVRGFDEGYAAGGGVYGPAHLVNCIVEHNSVWGDPISSATGDPVCGGGTAFASLEQCVVRNNSVSGPNTTGHSTLRGHAEGGGIYAGNASGCTIEGNVVVAQSRDDLIDTDLGLGGGAARAALSDCVVRHNRVQPDGFNLHGPDMGGAGLSGGSALRCEIYGNVVEPSFGGGMSSGGGARSAIVRLCSIRDNVADWGGGARSATGTVRQCTIFRNQARLSGGGASECLSLDSCIVWDNTPNEIGGAVPTAVAYCCIGDPSWAVGTSFDADPRLWNVNVPDLHLRPGSPCIDAGNPAAPLDPNGSRADVGARAFDPYYCAPALNYCTAKTNSLGCVPQIAAFGDTYGGPWAPSLWITCEHVLNNKLGVLLYGTGGRASGPFLGGTLCVAPPTRRTTIQLSGGSVSGSDCSGVYAFDFGTWITSGADPALAPGAQVNAQYWSRDPQSTASAGLSDGVELVICN